MRYRSTHTRRLAPKAAINSAPSWRRRQRSKGGEITQQRRERMSMHMVDGKKRERQRKIYYQYILRTTTVVPRHTTRLVGTRRARRKKCCPSRTVRWSCFIKRGGEAFNAAELDGFYFVNMIFRSSTLLSKK